MTTITTVTTASQLADYYIWFANDVGSYLSNHKLQKLLYYAQAWYLGVYGKPLFDADFQAWKQAPTDAARIVWEAKTQRIKLSTFAEEFFRQLAGRVTGGMLLKKGELHRLVAMVDPKMVAAEVVEKLDLLNALFESANRGLPGDSVND